MNIRITHCIAFVILSAAYSYSYEQLMNYNDEELVEVILSKRKENQSLIYSATGKAILVNERLLDSGRDIITEKNKKKERLPSPYYERRQIVWYASEDHRRTDIVSLDIPENKERGMLPKNMKQCWSPDSNIYVHYRPSGKVEAYINNPMKKEYFLPRFAVARFDPLSFYEFHDLDLKKWIYGSKENSNADIEILKESGRYVFKISYRKQPLLSVIITVDPEQGFNVTQFVSQNNGQIMEKVEIKYKELEANGTQVYFPQHYDYFRDWTGFSENLNIEFAEVKINEEIDDDVFAFAGMDLPPATILRDMRADPANPIVTYYGGWPDKAMQPLLDDLSLNGIANTIQKSDINGPFSTNETSKEVESLLPNEESDINSLDANTAIVELPEQDSASSSLAVSRVIKIACTIFIIVGMFVLLKRKKATV